MDEAKLNPRCKGCAFTLGTLANSDSITQLKVELCLIAHEPFLCHSNAVEDIIPAGKERVCIGWAEAVQGKEYPPDWRRRIALAQLAEIRRAEDGEEYNEQDVNQRIIQAVMGAQEIIVSIAVENFDKDVSEIPIRE